MLGRAARSRIGGSPLTFEAGNKRKNATVIERVELLDCDVIDSRKRLQMSARDPSHTAAVPLRALSRNAPAQVERRRPYVCANAVIDRARP